MRTARLRLWLKRLWAAPCSAVGLLLAAAVLALGGRARWSSGALEVSLRERPGQCGRLARRLPFRAVVFGHVILAVTQEELQCIGPHERVHVEQYERWGPLFFLAYGSSSLWQLLHGRDAYWDNRFEVQARERSRARLMPVWWDSRQPEADMADNPSIRGGSDRERINVNQEHELRHWAKKLDATPEQIKEAVQAVGDRADKVELHLKGSRASSNADREGGAR